MANISDLSRDEWMLSGPLAKKGYDWWWHSFTATSEKTGKRKAFYIEFFTCNPAWSKEIPVICWNNSEAADKKERPSYVMINVGFWGKEHGQLHNFYSWKDVTIEKGIPFGIQAGECSLSETRTQGNVRVTPQQVKEHPEWMSDAGEMEWDLQIFKQVAYHVGYGANAFFRKLNAFEMFWHAEGMKTLYEGYVILNGEKYIVSSEDSYGYADKNWGGNFTSPWVWLSSNNLKSAKTGLTLKNSVFNIGGGRPKAFGIALNRKLLGEFWYEGKDYEFNFSKFWTFSRTKFHCTETDTEILWDVVQKTSCYELVTHIVCNKDEMLLINYEAPDGTKKHNRLWNGGTGKGVLYLYKRNLFGKATLIDKIYARNIGCEYGEYDN